jgi:hypothetical protein
MDPDREDMLMIAPPLFMNGRMDSVTATVPKTFTSYVSLNEGELTAALSVQGKDQGTVRLKFAYS